MRVGVNKYSLNSKVDFFQMRRKLENLSNKKEIIKCSMDCMQVEIDRITNDHNEHLKRLFESHNQQISETKKKQWVIVNQIFTFHKHLYL